MKQGTTAMTASVTVSEIDFDRSCYSIAPLVFRKLSEKPDPGLAVKFLNRLGMDGLPIVLNILNRLSEADKNELVIIGVNSFREKIMSVIKKVLSEYALSEAISFGGIAARSSGGKIEITVFGLELDYAQLAGSRLIAEKLNTGALGRFSGFLGGAGKALEGPVLKLLSSQEIKNRILAFAASRLEKFGIYMKLNDFHIDRFSGMPEESAPSENTRFKLPGELEDKIAAAAAEYFKSISS